MCDLEQLSKIRSHIIHAGVAHTSEIQQLKTHNVHKTIKTIKTIILSIQ